MFPFSFNSLSIYFYKSVSKVCFVPSFASYSDPFYFRLQNLECTSFSSFLFFCCHMWQQILIKENLKTFYLKLFSFVFNKVRNFSLNISKVPLLNRLVTCSEYRLGIFHYPSPFPISLYPLYCALSPVKLAYNL